MVTLNKHFCTDSHNVPSCGRVVKMSHHCCKLFPTCQRTLQHVKAVRHSVDLSHTNPSHFQSKCERGKMCTVQTLNLFLSEQIQIQHARSLQNRYHCAALYQPFIPFNQNPVWSVVPSGAGALLRVVCLVPTPLRMERIFLMSRLDHRLWSVEMTGWRVPW